MKCPSCNYRHNEPDRDIEEFKLISDEEKEFIQVGDCQRVYINHEFKEVYLMACPICYTVQMKRW